MSSAPTKSLPSGADKNKMKKASAALFRLPKPLQMPFVCYERHPTPFDIPSRWKPQRELMVRALRVAFADFSAAPWQGLEKSERCPNNSFLFRPQAAVVVVAVQVLTGPQSGIRHPLTFLAAGSRALNNSPLGCCLPCLRQCRAVQVLTGNKKEHPDGCSFLLWASQDLNPGPSGYENVANFEIPFFLWNLVTI